MWRTVLLVAVLVAPTLSLLTLQEQTCDANRRRVNVATANANVLIGGLFTVREAGTGGIGCGLPSKELLQVYEAARWTIQELNNNNYVPGVRFGMEAFDTCTLVGSAMEAVQEFYPQSVSRSGSSLNGVNYCSKNNNVFKIGLLGTMQSGASMSIAEMAPRIPASVISMRSAAPPLSNKNVYPTFLRTDQPVAIFARALSALFKQLQWEKIIIVHGDNSYGVGGYQEVLRAAYESGVCVSGTVSVPHVGSVAEYRSKLQALSSFGATAAVFYGNPNDALTTMQALELVPGVANIKWLFGNIDLETDYSAYTAAQGAIATLASTNTVTAFKNYYTNLNVNNPPAENPWLRDWYMYKYQCRFNGVNYAPFNSMPICQTSPNPRPNDYRQSQYVEQTMLAVTAYAEGIKRVCGGVSGVCNALRNMDPITFHNNYLSKLDVTLPQTFPIAELRGRRLAFDVNGDPIVSAYTFYNFNNATGAFSFKQFATYTNGNLQVTTTPTFPRMNSLSYLPVSSPCSTSGCTNCLQPARDITLAYKPGDVVIAVLINAHEADEQGLNCGQVIPDRLIDAVAARYAAQTSTALGNDVSLGYLIVDVCPGMQAAQSFLTNLIGGYKLYTDSTGLIISTTNIIAVMDMTQEETAWKMAPLLASLGLPQIRVAPTSSMLLRNPRFPRLISALPSQDTVQLSIVQMLSALNWNYVQIVSEADGSYYQAAENFRRVASRMNVCIAMWSTFNMDPVTMVNRMRNVPNAPVVVVFGSVKNMRSLLQAMKSVTASAAVQRQLTLVSGSEEFGTSDNVVAGYDAETSGSLFVQLAERSDLQMNNWLTGLSLSDIANDAFLAQWFEHKYSCSLTPTSRADYDRVCSSLTSITPNSVYNGYAPYIVSGVNSVAGAVRTILNANCSGSSGVCPAFRSLKDLGQRIVDIMSNSNTNSEFQIMNGEGMSDLLYFNRYNQAFINVGRFDTNSRRISTLSPNQIYTGTGVLATTVNTQCTGRCVQCQDSYSYQQVGYVPGDWLVAGTFSLSNPGPEGQQPFVCGDVRTTTSYQNVAAMMFALSQINSGHGPVKLNNVTLGGLVMDHCSNKRRAYGQVADVYSGLTEMTWIDMMGGSGHFTSNDILAWITDNTASTHEVAEILQPIGVSIVSPAATAASLMDNPTFFRTIQGDTTTAMAIVKLCKTLGFTYIQVVHSASSYGRDGLKTIINIARQEGLCVVNSYEMADASNAASAVNTLSAGTTKVVVLYMGSTTLTSAFLSAAAQRNTDRLTILSPEPYKDVVTSIPNRNNLVNLLSLQLQHPLVTEFTNYINDVALNSQNPFFAPFYMKIFQCNLPGYYMYVSDCVGQTLTSSSAYVRSNFDLSTINAVYAVAGALQTTLVEFCGKDYDGECSAFTQSDDMYNRFVENLKVVQFQDPTKRLFRFFEREGNVVYDILQFNGNQYETIGEYGGASLTLNNPAQMAAKYTNVVSQCSTQCSECVFSGVSFSLTPGDVYLAGIFDVHTQGQGVFDCGAINSENGFQLLEAFHFALQQVNSNKGRFADILPGVTLGGVGLDACQSAIRGGYLVSNINNGLTTLARDGREIRPEEIDMYIGTYSSDSSIYLARILTDLQVPQISYAATTNTLDNEYVYPYFFRTVPADDKQVMGMLSYLNKNDLRYVQLLYTSNSYGEQGIAQFDLLLRQYNYSICVAQRVDFPDSAVVSEESSDDVVTKLLQKPVANTVVIFAGTEHIRAFLQAVARNPTAVGTLKLVGPTTWGDKQSVTDNIRDVADNAVTFVLDFQGGVGNFLDSYLTKRNPANAGNNPWFEEWFQHTLNCYTSPSNAQDYPRPCGTNADLKTNVREDNSVLHVMNAVYSAAFALDAALKDKCGNNYVAVCEAYRSSNERRTLLRDKLDHVNFTDDTNTPFYFVDREGNKGYKLYKWSTSPLDTDVIYNREPIGSYSISGGLTLNMDRVPKYDNSCERKDACVECPTIRNRGVRYALGGNPNGDMTLVGVFDVHERGSELYQCGPINLEGFYKFLSFFWTFNEIALNSGVRLLALDTCSSSLRVGQDLYSLLKDGTLCNSDFFNNNNDPINNIAAVLVTGRDNTVAAARVLEPLRVPYVSADSVSPLMDRYQYLLRTRTPWSGYVRILMKFLVDNAWTYVSSIYVGGGMGQAEYMAVQELAQEYGVCLQKGLSLPADSSDDDIRSALNQLDSTSGANVVVLFSMPALTVRILRLAQELGIANDFLWVFAMEEEDMNRRFPTGLTFRALVLQPVVPTRERFQDFVQNLAYDNTNSNLNRAMVPKVWWEDFYQTTHSCRLPGAQYPLDYDTVCSLDLLVDDYTPSKSLHYSYLASAFSLQGLESFFSDECRAGEALQDCLARQSASQADPQRLIRDSILKVVVGADDTTYRFNRELRYVEAAYNINLTSMEDGTLTTVRYRTYKDGTFTAYNKVLEDTSVCKRLDGCGCLNQLPDTAQQVSQPYDDTNLRNYFKYNNKGDQIYDWPVWAIAVAVLTSLGLFITVIIFIYLVIAYPVRSGTSILGYLTMIGIMGVYAINFAFFLHASDKTCGARRFLMGVVYSIVFAPLLVKAVDNWRFADLEYGNRPYRGLTSSLTLFLIALGVVLIQCIIPIEWLILVHPTASRLSNNDMHDFWWCDPHDFYDIGLVCSFIFVMFIVLLTAIFAALAWDSESNNRESRWILVSAIATAGCFLVWMIVTTNAGPIYRDPAVAIANFVNATLLLIFIPIRKLHLLYLAKTEKQDNFANGEFDPYSNVYANQTYDPEGDDYVYENAEKPDDFSAD